MSDDASHVKTALGLMDSMIRSGEKPVPGDRYEEVIGRAFESLRALAARPEPRAEGLRKFVWLIEQGQPEGLDHPRWWGVTDSRTGAYGWVHSAFAADQFATRDDAEAVITRFDLPNHPFNARAVEHGFLRDNIAVLPSEPQAEGLREALVEPDAHPFRWTLDGTPCWCVSADEPHDGWVHAPACQNLLRERVAAALAATPSAPAPLDCPQCAMWHDIGHKFVSTSGSHGPEQPK